MPGLRKLRHLQQVAIRNLYVPPSTGRVARGLPDVFFTLQAEDDTILYRSETVSFTVNPSWVPLEWSAAPPRVCDSPLVRLRVFAASSPRGQPPCYMPAPSADAAAAHLLLDCALDVRELHYLGFDVFEALAAAGSSAPSSRGGAAAQRDAADVAAYNLDALPLNALILVLDDGCYMLPSTARAIMRGEAPTPSPSNARMGKHDLRRGFDTVNRLVQLTRDIELASSSTVATLQAVGEDLNSHAHVTLAGVHDRLVDAVQRVHAARRRRDAAHTACAIAEARCAARRQALCERAAYLNQGLQAVRDVSVVLPAMEREVSLVRDEVAMLRTLTSAKQLALVAETRALYHIAEVEKGRRYSIRGLELPDRDLHTFPEEQISTALGYACHLVSLLAKYLQVPLRYFPQPLASRSSMRDEVLNHAMEYPLYFKGVDQNAFETGVLMLRRDVRQLLNAQGVSAMGPGNVENHMLANLLKLFTMLLDAPLPGPDTTLAAVAAAAVAPAAATVGAAAAATASTSARSSLIAGAAAS